MNKKFEKLGFYPADILLPKDQDMRKWAVVACDQFTSEPEYWQAVEQTVGDAPSTLRLILPEANLKAPNVDEYIADINASMDKYLADGVFQVLPESLVYIERQQSDGRIRHGLIGMVDLDAYDFTPGSGALIRATEGTVLDRIPPRARVRRNAPIELPHVMLLIDDPEKTVIEPLTAASGEMDKLYDFDLMQNGGHIRGYKLTDRQVNAVADAHDRPVIEAVAEARRERIAVPVLVGHADEIAAMLRELGEDPAAYEIIPGDTDTDCAAKAVALCAEGRANFLMKGILGTADLMRAVFNKEHGLRTGRLTTHCMFYEIPALGRMIILTDGGVNTFPDLEKKADILENAAMCFQALGYETIHAACICGAEQVNPKIQSTVDADALAHMTDRWAKYGMDVCGPVALDLAVSPEACRHKHYSAPGAGMADILLVPNYEVGNGIGKAATLFGGAKNAGVILGAKVPIVLVSRSDSAYSKLASIAAGSVLSRRMHLS